MPPTGSDPRARVSWGESTAGQRPRKRRRRGREGEPICRQAILASPSGPFNRRCLSLKNPYIVDRPLTDWDLFFGRTTSFDQLATFLSAGHRLLFLYGERYTGKTSFVNQLPLRLSSRYRVSHIDIAHLMDPKADPLWMIMVGVAQALEQEPPDKRTQAARPYTYASHYLGALVSAAEGLTHLVCLDGLAASGFSFQRRWREAIETLRRALGEIGGLAILLVIDGLPGEVGLTEDFPDLPAMVLGPLEEDETESLLMVPVRGTLAFEYEVVSKVHRLSGGYPFFVQLCGRLLFDRRVGSGWVGVSDVDNVVDQIVALGAPQFESAWGATSPAGRIVLCALVEMAGHHGLGSAEDVFTHLERLRVQVPIGDIERALDELVTRDLLERLGGETFRIRVEVFRRWLRRNRSTLETVRQSRRYRRSRLRRVTPARSKHIDWMGVFLWMVAGLLAALIGLVWRSRDKAVFWTGDQASSPRTGTVTAPARGPTIALPTPETGVAPGHIVYVSRERAGDPWQVWVMRSDGSDPERLTGDEGNNTSPVWAPNGRKIAFVSDRDGNREIYAMNADGNEQLNLTRNAAEDWTPSWSPDGREIAFASFRDGNWEIYVMDADGSKQRRLTRNRAADYGPSWSPDGRSMAFVSDRDGNLEIYVMAADGSNQTRFTFHESTDQSPGWSPDGAQLVWASYRDGNMEVYGANIDGSELRNLSQDAFADDHGPTFSPWGRRLAFYSNRDQGWDIYTLDPDTGERVNLTMSPALEQAPHWGP